MLDEIQTGMCRTGTWFAYQHDGVVPDVVTAGQGTRQRRADRRLPRARRGRRTVFKPGNHGSTFGGNPLVCRVGLAVIDELEKGKLASRAAKHGEYLLGRTERTPGR